MRKGGVECRREELSVEGGVECGREELSVEGGS